MKIEIRPEQWTLRRPFHITGHVFTALDVIVVTLRDGPFAGRGEAASVFLWNSTVTSMTAEIEAVRKEIEAGISRETLRNVLPAGGARNAVDCALWDLEAKRTGSAAWRLAGLQTPRPLLTTYTLGVNSPEKMAQGARDFAGARALKLKLNGDGADAERVRAVRAVRPDVWLGVDANQGFTLDGLQGLLPVFVEACVQVVEQPLPIGQEEQLEGLRSPIPLAADESVRTVADLSALVGRFDMINIKLDKCGGLTEGLLMAGEARRLGFKLMVGNMFGTSLAMAPAFVLGQLCEVVDLDGPIEFVRDRVPSASYENGRIWCAPQIWGAPEQSAASA